MSHTPGPWYSHLYLSVACENDGEYGGATCITNTPADEYAATGNSGDWVAFVPHDRDHAANAALIAAAPDLLAACKALAHDIRAFQFTDGDYRLSEDAARQMLQFLERVISQATEGTNGKERSLD